METKIKNIEEMKDATTGQYQYDFTIARSELDASEYEDDSETQEIDAKELGIGKLIESVNTNVYEQLSEMTMHLHRNSCNDYIASDGDKIERWYFVFFDDSKEKCKSC